MNEQLVTPSASRPRRGGGHRLQGSRFTPHPFEDVGALVSPSCPGLHLFSSDYPHAEGGCDPIGRLERGTADLGAAERALFFADNFRVLYPDRPAPPGVEIPRQLRDNPRETAISQSSHS